MQALSNKVRGFTIVELIVVLAVSGIIFTVVLDTLGNYYRDNSVSLGRGVQETDTRSVLRSIEKDLYNSIGFGSDISDPTLAHANTAPFGSGNLSASPWDYTTNGNGPVLITYKNPVTQQPDADATNSRLPVFLQPTGGCGDLSDATPALMAQIYFIGPDPSNSSRQNLYRRTIVPTSVTPLCGTMVPANSSCAANSIAAHALVCRDTDALILKDIRSFAVRYFDPGVQTAYTMTGNSTIDDPHVDGAQAVEIEVETYQRLTNDDAVNTNTSSIRINHL